MDTHCIAHTRQCTGAVSMVDFRRGVPDRETYETMDHSSIAGDKWSACNGTSEKKRRTALGETEESISLSLSLLPCDAQTITCDYYPWEGNADRIDSCLTEPELPVAFCSWLLL